MIAEFLGVSLREKSDRLCGKKILPDTMVSPETGQVLLGDVRPFVVTYKGKSGSWQ